MVAVIFLLVASVSISLAAQDCGLISPNVELALSRSRSSSEGKSRSGREEGSYESRNRIIGGQSVPTEGLPWQVLHYPVSGTDCEDTSMPLFREVIWMKSFLSINTVLPCCLQKIMNSCYCYVQVISSVPQVLVRYRMNDKRSQCGGSIVSRNFVITAAH